MTRTLGDRGSYSSDRSPAAEDIRLRVRREWMHIAARQRRRVELEVVELGGEG